MGRDASHGSSSGGGMSQLGYLLGGAAAENQADNKPEYAPPATSTPLVNPSQYTTYEIENVRKLTIKELRTALRGRGLNPAGGHQQLEERLTEALNAQRTARSSAPVTPDDIQAAGRTCENSCTTTAYNPPPTINYNQNERPVQRVLAPPGGHSLVHFG